MLSDIDYYLRDSSRGFARIQRGEIPDGSGSSLSTVLDLSDYFFLPGVAGGQIAHGDTEAGGNLTLRSTNNDTGGTVIVKGMATQTADPFQIQNSAGTVLTNVTSAGDIAGGVLTTDSLRLLSNSFNTSVARIELTNTTDVVFDVPAASVNALTLSMGLATASLDGQSLTMRLLSSGGNSSSLLINNDGGSAATVPFIIERSATQTADLTRWRDDDGTTILSRIDKDGTFIGPISSTSSATFLDSLFKILDDGDNSKTLSFSLGGASANADLTLAWVGTTDKTVTIPDIAGTLALLEGTQIFTGAKTFQTTTNVRSAKRHLLRERLVVVLYRRQLPGACAILDSLRLAKSSEDGTISPAGGSMRAGVSPPNEVLTERVSWARSKRRGEKGGPR